MNTQDKLVAYQTTPNKTSVNQSPARARINKSMQAYAARVSLLVIHNVK